MCLLFASWEIFAVALDTFLLWDCSVLKVQIVIRCSKCIWQRPAGPTRCRGAWQGGTGALAPFKSEQLWQQETPAPVSSFRPPPQPERAGVVLASALRLGLCCSPARSLGTQKPHCFQQMSPLHACAAVLLLGQLLPEHPVSPQTPCVCEPSLVLGEAGLGLPCHAEDLG